MQQIYKVLTGLLSLTGSVSIVMTGEVSPLMSLTLIGIFPGYYRLLKDRPAAPKWVIGGLSLMTLVTYFFDALVISNDYFLAVAHLTITFQAIKSFDLREPWDHLQVYFVSLLQLIIVSELTHSIVFGALFMFFLVMLVAAMVFSHFMKEGTTLRVGMRRPIMVISVLTVLMTALLFVSLPRISGGLWNKSHVQGIRTVGFSEKVEFGSFEDVKLDPTVVMRVEISGTERMPYYWRGMTLNYFDGTSWKNTMGRNTLIYKREEVFVIQPLGGETPTVQRIFLEPVDTDVIFALERAAEVDAPGRILFVDDTGDLHLPLKRGKSVSYTVASISGEPTVRGRTDAYLQLPGGMERISQLAHDVAAKMRRPADKAATIEDYLRRNYTYSLTPPRPGEGTDPIEEFLFNSRTGYCEHYASAMVLMLRSLGIPARIVNGFAGGDLNEYGGYLIVRQSNAHSWVEAAVDGAWRTFDPTPAFPTERPGTFELVLDMLKMKWNRYVVAFSFADQKEIYRVFSSVFRLPEMPRFGRPGIREFAVLLGIAVLLAAVLMRLPKHRRYGFLSGRYVRLRHLIGKKGVRVSPSSTPSEVAREAAHLDAAADIREFIAIYERCRFGGRDLTPEDRKRYEGLLNDIKARLKS